MKVSLKYSRVNLVKNTLLSFIIIVFLFPSVATAISVNYTYDKAGRLTKAKYGNYSITYKYDKTGNLLQKVVKKGSMILMIVPVISAGSNN